MSLCALSPTKQLGPFCDFLPASQVCKPFIQFASGFSLVIGAFYWTHIHELPDLPSAQLCYSWAVTREARRSRRALLGFRATAPAPPDSSELPSPLLYLPVRCVRHGVSCASERRFIGHISTNYLIYPPRSFAIVGPSLARLAVRGERFWASARQRPRRPDSSELPSPLLYLPGSVVSRHGRILVRAMRLKWPPPERRVSRWAPALAGGLDFSPAKKQSL